jgi:hypothetical protein
MVLARGNWGSDSSEDFDPGLGGFKFQTLPSLGFERLGRGFACRFASAPPRLAPFDKDEQFYWIRCSSALGNDQPKSRPG